MRHKKAFRRLGVDSGHRKSLLRSLCTNLAEHGEITTTLAKAKELKREFDKLITLGKKKSLHARRIAMQKLHSKKSVYLVFDEYAPKYEDRQGGYTRIMKLNNRLGDNAQMARISLVDYAAKATAEKSSKAEQTPKQ